MSIASLGEKRYVRLTRDCHTKFTWTYFLKGKSEAVNYFKRFLCGVQANSVPPTVQRVCSESGGDFSVNGPFGTLCGERGINQEPTTAQAPERNAVTERGISWSLQLLLLDCMRLSCSRMSVFPFQSESRLKVYPGQRTHSIVAPLGCILRTAHRVRCGMVKLRQLAFYPV